LLSVAVSGAGASVEHTAVMIALDLTRPWSFEKALERWTRVAQEVLAAKTQVSAGGVMMIIIIILSFTLVLVRRMRMMMLLVLMMMMMMMMMVCRQALKAPERAVLQSRVALYLEKCYGISHEEETFTIKSAGRDAVTSGEQVCESTWCSTTYHST
jgi:uncharacterized membrane protein YgcG